MIIGILTLEIHLPYSQSLKEKRKILNGFRDRIRNKFNAAIAEIDYQDKWQRAKVGIVTLNSQKKLVDQILSRIIQEAEKGIDGEIIASEIQYI